MSQIGPTKAQRDEEFAAFYEPAASSLMRTAWLLTGDPDAARELVQAALVKTYAAWGRIRRDQALGYARRVLVNHRTDVWRATRREVAWHPELDPTATTADTVDDRDAVLRLLAALPPRQRAVVVLRYYNDLSEQAVADLLGLSIGTVKSTASRALSALRSAAVEGEVR